MIVKYTADTISSWDPIRRKEFVKETAMFLVDTYGRRTKKDASYCRYLTPRRRPRPFWWSGNGIESFHWRSNWPMIANHWKG